MAVELLKKGGSVNLRKDNPNLSKIYVGLGWDPVKSGIFSSRNFDIDASVIAMDKNDREIDVLYYGKTSIFHKALVHHGDNLTGEGDGDDEVIEMDLNAIPKEVNRLAVIINIYEAYSKGQNFSQVNNCYVHVVDPKSGKELVRYNISDDSTYGKETGIFVADIYRRDKEWKFKALGQGVKVKSISEMVRMKCR